MPENMSTENKRFRYERTGAIFEEVGERKDFDRDVVINLKLIEGKIDHYWVKNPFTGLFPITEQRLKQLTKKELIHEL